MEYEGYKKLLFDIPKWWNINDCHVTIKDNKVIIDHPINHSIDHCIFERYTSELEDGDDYLIEKLGEDSWETKVCIAAGR